MRRIDYVGCSVIVTVIIFIAITVWGLTFGFTDFPATELEWANWDRDCVCGAHMKMIAPKSKDGYAYKCLDCGRWYAWAWTDPLKELKFSGD